MTTTRHPFLCRIDGNQMPCDLPYIEFKVVQGDFRLSTHGHIDSGADVTVINAEIADALDINLDGLPTRRLVGVTGEGVAYCTKVVLEIEGHEPFECSVAFVWGLTVPALLGHKDFFDLFDISFKKREGFVELTKH